MPEIREPIKQTSIDKKKRIIDAGLKLFSEKGYFSTNTAEIAKVAGVSTGIVYQYFKDKKDILIYAVKIYFDSIFAPMEEKLKEIKNLDNFEQTLRELIILSIDSHVNHSIAHEEMIAMSHLDEDVQNLFIESEHKIIDKILYFLEGIGINVPHMHEKVHMAYNLIESLCHEYVYHKHDFIDYNYTTDETIKLIKALFTEK